MNRRLTALTGSAVLALTALLPAAAHAEGAAKPDPTKPGATVPGTNRKITAAQANACFVWQGGVTAAGGHHFSDPTATTPPTVPDDWTDAGVFKPGQIRLSARQTIEPDISGTDRYGYVVIGDALYYSYYQVYGDGTIDNQSLSRVGGGWGSFTFLETSEYESPDNAPKKIYRSTSYALRNDGVLFRWDMGAKGWRSTGSYKGFSAVKTMTLIAKTPTYDTFLANTRGGALYTIRIPSASPMKPIVKQVRTRTWQGFETLSAMGCGNYGSLLLAVDKDTDKSYLYAVGHANGLSTVIQSRGEVKADFNDPVSFRWVPIPVYDTANGD
ncbi:hypothetical protein GCM10009630_08180 [Kribbella jejuensis]|uniref:Uncharacterized protein n=1 Tax=Kribbella jejuensis TaxID=236068 RepID=A0A542EVP6_9ACTN|nr:hypothetical protein [Kribbella jejuensis]TQJ19417.1 hypothetical protein FB475_3584 [Kribbella jejuensis]